MDFKDGDDEVRAPRLGRDARQETNRDRSDDSTPARVVGERFDADQMNEDDDILPRRVVGEQPIDLGVADQTEVQHTGEVRGDLYNMSRQARRGDPYGEDVSGIPTIEDEPMAQDIMPDQLQEEAPGARADDDEELTARSGTQIRPITPDELPEG